MEIGWAAQPGSFQNNSDTCSRAAIYHSLMRKSIASNERNNNHQSQPAVNVLILSQSGNTPPPMAPKKKGGTKKAKAPAYDATAEAIAAFGLKMHEVLRTPLGQQVTVIGVRYEDPALKAGGQLWVLYENGQEAPLEGRSNNAAALGYRRCTEADQIRRDVLQQEAAQQKLEENRRLVQEVMALMAQGLPIPEHLLPKNADDKAKKPKKDSKADAGGKKKA